MKLAIIGVGLIGGSLGLCLKDKLGEKIFITGLCRTEESMYKAKHLGAVDLASSNLEEIVINADIVFLSPPVLQIVPMIKKILPFLKSGVILTDAGSTKKYVWRELKKFLPSNIFYIAGHPMTGREKSGVEYADKNLFRNKAYVIIKDSSTPNKVKEKLMNLLKMTQAKFIDMDIDKHDHCASIISHVPHIIAATLVNFLNESEDPESCLDLIGGGFKDTTRIASSNADMWADICMTNGKEISQNLRDFQKLLNKIINAIEKRERQTVYDYFKKSKEQRDKLLDSVSFDPN